MSDNNNYSWDNDDDYFDDNYDEQEYFEDEYFDEVDGWDEEEYFDEPNINYQYPDDYDVDYEYQ